jgi:hypothetical protein
MALPEPAFHRLDRASFAWRLRKAGLPASHRPWPLNDRNATPAMRMRTSECPVFAA